MIDLNLYGRVAHDEVAANEIARYAGENNDPVGVPRDDVVDDDVLVSTENTDAEVEALISVAVSTQPVRTEPVASRGTGQSYAAAG